MIASSYYLPKGGWLNNCNLNLTKHKHTKNKFGGIINTVKKQHATTILYKTMQTISFQTRCDDTELCVLGCVGTRVMRRCFIARDALPSDGVVEDDRELKGR